MALWLDDNLSESERWWSMSPAGRACLIELWLYCRRAKNNGVMPTERLHKASDAFSVEVMQELIDQRWLHKDGAGCGTDTCPRGLQGYAVMHDYLQHQESAQDMTARIERSRELSRKGNHKRWHEEKGLLVKTCVYCYPEDEEIPA